MLKNASHCWSVFLCIKKNINCIFLLIIRLVLYQNQRLMKNRRNIAIVNRGLASLFFLFFFLYSIHARTFTGYFSATSKKAVVENVTAKANTANGLLLTLDNSADYDDENSYSESEIDDVDFVFFTNCFSSIAFLFFKEISFFTLREKEQSSKLPLYDLYCNWKFHLS